MFRTTLPLRFGDCDPSGIAYYPSYLKLMDGAIEDFFESLGAPRRRMIEETRIGTPTITLELTFLKPGFQGDILHFAIAVRTIGRTSLDLGHTVSTNGDTLWTARHRLVATDLDTHTSRPWPDDLRQKLLPHLET
ncbi:acyl-CoA thioesterase [Rhizobiaceae bacterium BDR2-2]|uniref:Acyl-CoA thioesterase n=1 Tax=Ectorhizobium quercum TaxID=2965071 RepID=A0AAE3N1R4_9HYPH|nr:thioesterase family protein [Ectorhizobium quercum]MCX8997142.1 acyl-CoA thioesterase [Ectorhizobium quercum]